MYEYKGMPDVSETNRTFAELIDESEITDKQNAFKHEMLKKYIDTFIYSLSIRVNELKAQHNQNIRFNLSYDNILVSTEEDVNLLSRAIKEKFPDLYIVNCNNATRIIQFTLKRGDGTITFDDFANSVRCHFTKTGNAKIRMAVMDEDGTVKIYPVSSVFDGKHNGEFTIYLSNALYSEIDRKTEDEVHRSYLYL